MWVDALGFFGKVSVHGVVGNDATSTNKRSRNRQMNSPTPNNDLAAHALSQNARNYFEGYGRHNLPGLQQLARFEGWQRLAQQEIERRANSLLQAFGPELLDASTEHPALLTGLLYAPDGQRMLPTYTVKKNGKRYRYYVSYTFKRQGATRGKAVYRT